MEAGLTVGRVLVFVAALAACEEQPTPVATASGEPTVSASAVPNRCANRCTLAGLCGWDEARGRCAAADDADCARSTACKTSGNCGEQAGECVPTKPEHCRKAERCPSEGLCTFTRPGVRCSATAKDCASSKGCARKGRCSPFRGKCDVADDDDCARSELCKRHGQCSAVPRKGSPIAMFTCKAADNDDCHKSEDCKDRGLCTAANGYCR